MVRKKTIDVCFILEGSYPYIPGGVSSWVHQLILGLPEKNFAIIAIMPRDFEHKPKYELPENVVDFQTVYLQKLMPGVSRIPHREFLFSSLKDILNAVIAGEAGFSEAEKLSNLSAVFKQVGYRILLNSKESWNWLLYEYERLVPDYSFINFFWSWRSLLAAIFSMMSVSLPRAQIYHSLSTGYAGLLGALAKASTGSPLLLTEHGIYTNERRIELNTSTWMSEEGLQNLVLDHKSDTMRALWMRSFSSLAKMCYEASDRIVTLFQNNKLAQIDEGADPNRIIIIPNGIDFENFSKFARVEPYISEKPVVALIGRVVPIKDIKLFIHACAQVLKHIPDLQVMIIGPLDEDVDYAKECEEMVQYLGISSAVTFTGQVKIESYLQQIDLVVLTSISEGQPLTLLEVGAAAIPSVATNVGACAEIIYGRDEEDKALGEGGIITGLANAREVADAILVLLQDKERYVRAAKTIKKRVATYYTKPQQMDSYRALYGEFLDESWR